jgi:hypothetical protein
MTRIVPSEIFALILSFSIYEGEDWLEAATQYGKDVSHIVQNSPVMFRVASWSKARPTKNGLFRSIEIRATHAELFNHDLIRHTVIEFIKNVTMCSFRAQHIAKREGKLYDNLLDALADINAVTSLEIYGHAHVTCRALSRFTNLHKLKLRGFNDIININHVANITHLDCKSGIAFVDERFTALKNLKVAADTPIHRSVCARLESLKIYNRAIVTKTEDDNYVYLDDEINHATFPNLKSLKSWALIKVSYLPNLHTLSSYVAGDVVFELPEYLGHIKNLMFVSRTPGIPDTYTNLISLRGRYLVGDCPISSLPPMDKIEKIIIHCDNGLPPTGDELKQRYPTLKHIVVNYSVWLAPDK